MKSIADNILLWGLVIGLIAAPISALWTVTNVKKTHTEILKSVTEACEGFTKLNDANSKNFVRISEGFDDFTRYLYSLQNAFEADRTTVGIKENGKIQIVVYKKIEGANFETFKEIELSPEKAKELAFGLDAMVKFIEAKEKAE